MLTTYVFKIFPSSMPESSYLFLFQYCDWIVGLKFLFVLFPFSRGTNVRKFHDKQSTVLSLVISALGVKCSNTRWFKYDRDCLHLFTHKLVPVIFEPPCTYWTEMGQKKNQEPCDPMYAVLRLCFSLGKFIIIPNWYRI